MFLAYTDASVKNNKALLAFVIIFEDKSKVRRKIVVNESDNNIAEALAIAELLSFLKYYNMRKGLIFFDSNGVKSQLKKRGRKIHNYLPKDTKQTLNNQQIRTQVIPRKYNLSHRICNEDKFFKSNIVSEINRSVYDSVPAYPDYFMQLSVLEEYRVIFNKPFATLHEVQIKLNKKIWLGKLVDDLEGVKVYQLYDKRIKVHGDTIIKITKVD